MIPDKAGHAKRKKRLRSRSQSEANPTRSKSSFRRSFFPLTEYSIPHEGQHQSGGKAIAGRSDDNEHQALTPLHIDHIYLPAGSGF